MPPKNIFKRERLKMLVIKVKRVNDSINNNNLLHLYNALMLF